MTGRGEQGIERFIIDGGKVRDFLLENGVKDARFRSGMRSADGESYTQAELKDIVASTTEEYGFAIPSQSHWSFFYILGSGELDRAYIYPPGYAQYVHVPYPTLESVRHISAGLTVLTPVPLLALYQSDRFAIPKFQWYEAGKLVSSSAVAGTQEYTVDYWIEDELQYVERAKASLKSGPFKRFLDHLDNP